MKNYGYSQYRSLGSIENMSYIKAEFKKSDRVSKHEDILDFIYASDPLTGFPSGCLSHYLNDSTRPEIKQFIEDYLLKNVPEQHVLSFPQDVANHIKDLDENFVFDCMQGQYETAEQYKDRMLQKIKDLSDSEKHKKWLDDLKRDLSGDGKGK